MVRYAPLRGLESGRSRRVLGPARFRPIGYRVGRGGPSPQPGPNPALGPGTPAPGPAVTPSPTPGPSPTAPTVSPLPSIPNPFSGLPNPLGDAATGWAAIGERAVSGLQVLLGAAILGVGLLVLLGETRQGGQLARSARRAVLRVGGGRGR